MSRNLPQDGETTYTGPVTPRVVSIPVIVTRHVPLDCIVDECGEIRVELGIPEDLPAEPLPPEIANLPADHESRVRP